MIKKKLIPYIFFFLLMPTYFAQATKTLNDAFKTRDGQINDPLDTVANTAGYNIQQAVTLESVVGRIILTSLNLLGIIFIVLLIYGGYLWMTDRGNDQEVAKAKKIIQYAIIGLVIVLSAYAISYFVLYNITQSTLKVAPQ